MATKYTDPLYDELDAQTTSRLGLPEGLLASIRTKGERSNSDQVSEAGARSVYQIVPATRKLIMDKYGIDPYLNEKNASLGAGYLLKESLDRNKGDTRLAALEYHGGTDRSNWGKRTMAYGDRVVGPDTEASGSRSLRAELAASQPQKSGIAQAYAAYQAGKMPPDVAAEFEADVNAGKVLLPAGATLKSSPIQKTSAPAQATQATPQQPTQAAPAAASAAPVQIPAEAAQAFANGTMPADIRAEMEADIKSGRAVLPPLPLGEDIKRGLGLGTRNLLVGLGQGAGMVYNPIAATINALIPREKSLSGLVTGEETPVVPLIPTLEGQASEIADKLGLPTALTPTERILATVQQMAASNIPTLGMSQAAATAKAAPAAVREAGAILAAKPVQQVVSGATAGAASEAAKAAGADTLGQTLAAVGGGAGPALVQAVGKAAAPTAQRVGEAVSDAAQAAAQRVTPSGRAQAAQAAGRNVGAAETEASAMRRANASELPVPVKLSKGQATRDFEQQRFEGETAKDAARGGALREHAAEQNEQLRQNLDAFIDQTGAQRPTNLGAGRAVDDALSAEYQRWKNKVNVAYRQAAKSPEALAQVDLNHPVQIGAGENAIENTLIGWLNEQPSGLKTTGVLDDAKTLAQRLGIAALDENGNLVPLSADVKTMEELRKQVNAINATERSDRRYVAIIKDLIDGQTAPVSGPLYQRARGLRTEMANRFENRSVVADLLSQKRGMDDRRVAIEDVVSRIVDNGSLDDLMFAGRQIKRSGASGRQAWAEIQGAVLERIKNKAFGNITRNERGDVVLSAPKLDSAIKELDADGKLEYLFGKRGAEQLRTLNEIAKDVRSQVPNATNYSNTAVVLAQAIDLALTSTTGVPLPVANGLRYAQKHIKDRAIRARITDALAQPK